jgi:4-hydroxybenzoate polyprenyltransferase
MGTTLLTRQDMPFVDTCGVEGALRSSPPLVVDLDGTLVKTDLLVESLLALLKQDILALFLVPWWLLKGRAYLKRQVSRRVSLNVRALPYNQKLVAHLRAERARGRRLILATASDERIARQVNAHMQLFDRVLASDGNINLLGRTKRDRLIAEFGEKHFDYAGDARCDLPVWASARTAILVDASPRVSRLAAGVAGVARVFHGEQHRLKSYLRALRLTHWLKNLLVFLPIVLAHRFAEPVLLGKVWIAFLAFGLCASSVYLMNDLMDLTADRLHPRKQQRPFAAGDLSVLAGLASVPGLLAISYFVSRLLPGAFLWMLALYVALNVAYSLCLKRIALLDVIVLAGLYTMRLMAGSAAVDIWPSSWLLAFSTFLFLSLALVKRYDELVMMNAEPGKNVQARGYLVGDKELLAAMGCGSGYLAVLILAMYISSGVAEIHYTRQHLFWLICPLLLYWISYIWLTAHRNKMPDDPLVFTLTDRVSWIVFLLAVLILILAI